MFVFFIKRGLINFKMLITRSFQLPGIFARKRPKIKRNRFYYRKNSGWLQIPQETALRFFYELCSSASARVAL
jgi:hypothetical protein